MLTVILSYESLFRQYQNFESTVFQGAQDNVRNTLLGLANFSVLEPLQATTSDIETGMDSASESLVGPILFTDDRVMLNKWFNELGLYLRVTKAQRYLILRLKNKAKILIGFYKK